MNINYFAVFLATFAQFVFGAIWYMPIFGKKWGKIHGFDKLSAQEKSDAQKSMGPLLGVQIFITLMTTLVLAKLITVLPNYSAIMLAVLAWVGFIVPTQIAAVIFGGTNPKWFVQKSLIMAGASLGCMLIAGAILGALRPEVIS